MHLQVLHLQVLHFQVCIFKYCIFKYAFTYKQHLESRSLCWVTFSFPPQLGNMVAKLLGRIWTKIVTSKKIAAELFVETRLEKRISWMLFSTEKQINH